MCVFVCDPAIAFVVHCRHELIIPADKFASGKRHYPRRHSINKHKVLVSNELFTITQYDISQMSKRALIKSLPQQLRVFFDNDDDDFESSLILVQTHTHINLEKVGDEVNEPERLTLSNLPTSPSDSGVNNQDTRESLAFLDEKVRFEEVLSAVLLKSIRICCDRFKRLSASLTEERR